MEYIKVFYEIIYFGLLKTIFIFLCCCIISIIIGTFLGIIRCKYINKTFLTNILNIATVIIRGVPFYIQLVMFYFILPSIFRIDLSPQLTGILSLGLCSSAYMGNIIKGILDALPISQWNTAKTLGYSPLETMRYIFLPQAYKIGVPLFINEFDQILKSTSILSTIGVVEITKCGFNIISRTLNPIPIYIFIATLYLSISYALYILSSKLSLKYK
jgi:His/Glu/Gln/Arg/opine family amino acid ABC transporter permease subunit